VEQAVREGQSEAEQTHERAQWPELEAPKAEENKTLQHGQARRIGNSSGLFGFR